MEFIGNAAGGLKPCKRYIATHDKNGKSIYGESPDQLFNAVPGFGGMAKSFSVNSVPANLTNDADVKAYRAEDGPTRLVNESIYDQIQLVSDWYCSFRNRSIVNTEPGANLLVIDLEPGAVSAMHRTVSIDFSICVQGEIDHELDGGEKVRLYPGVSLMHIRADSTLSHVNGDRTILSKEAQIIDGPIPAKTIRQGLLR